MASRIPRAAGWRGRVYVPGGGERTKTFPTKREAIAWETAQRGRRQDSNESVDQWLARVGQDVILAGLSPSTRANYQSHIRLRIRPTLGHRKLSALRAHHIEAAQRSWAQTGVSGTVVAGTSNCLARILRFAVRAGDLAASPMSAVERVRPGVERRTPTLAISEVEILADACGLVNGRYGDYVRLAAFLGLRAGELVALQVGDVDLATGVVTVRRAYSAGQLQTPKSRRSRQVPVMDAVRPTLVSLVRTRKPDAPLLVGPLGGRFYHSNFRTKVQWTKLVARLGWPDLHFHDLRATAIVTWIRSGVPLSTVRSMAGHASLSTTDRYARIARNDLAGAAAQINSYIDRTQQTLDGLAG